MAKKGLSRESIVDTAAQLAELHGLESVTLRELADALGVKTASLYNHLQGLPELNARLAERALDRLIAALMEAMRGKEGADALRALAFAYRAFAHEHPELYKAMLWLPQFEETRLIALKNQFMMLFREVLMPYNLSYDEQTHLSRMIRSALHGYVSLEAAGFFRKPMSAASDDSFACMIDRLCEEIQRFEVTPYG